MAGKNTVNTNNILMSEILENVPSGTSFKFKSRLLVGNLKWPDYIVHQGSGATFQSMSEKGVEIRVAVENIVNQRKIVEGREGYVDITVPLSDVDVVLGNPDTTNFRKRTMELLAA